MIDKNGKVFGKINIIDLLVLIVIIAAVAVFAFSRVSHSISNKANENAETFTMELATDEVLDYVLEHVKVGEPIYDADYNIKMGTVKSFEVGPSRVYAANADGEMVASEKEGFSSVKIVGEMEGTLEDFGATIKDTKYGVGHTFTVRVGRAKIYLKVSDIK